MKLTFGKAAVIAGVVLGTLFLVSMLAPPGFKKFFRI